MTVTACQMCKPSERTAFSGEFYLYPQSHTGLRPRYSFFSSISSQAFMNLKSDCAEQEPQPSLESTICCHHCFHSYCLFLFPAKSLTCFFLNFSSGMQDEQEVGNNKGTWLWAMPQAGTWVALRGVNEDTCLAYGCVIKTLPRARGVML